MSEETTIDAPRWCDICSKHRAVIDGKTLIGPWANMCQRCWDAVGVGRLGTGYGQRLVVRSAS